MWTPRVLRPLLQPRLGGGAASFARAVLARHGPVSDSQRYPDAWLVFREAEERAAAQTVSETRLTQLTLRLALQLNEYYAAAPGREPPPAMEGAALRETLRVCLTALERRDRETCREVRLLTGLSAPAGAAQAPVPAEVLRERLVQRLDRLERERTAPLPPPLTGRSFPSPAVHGGRSFPTAAPLWQQDRTAAQPVSSAPPPRTGGIRRAERALDAHRERFLQLLQQAEPREAARLWRLVETRAPLTVCHRQRWAEEFHLPPEERLERLVRESSHQTYALLLQTLERELRVPALPSAAGHAPSTVPGGPSAPPAAEGSQPGDGTVSLIRRAAPLLDWLSQSLQRGRVRRKEMLSQLEAAPAAAQNAFLALAEESGVFHTARKRREQAGQDRENPWTRLTLLTQESRRQELEALVRWTRTLRAEDLRRSPAPPDSVPSSAAAPPPASAPSAPEPPPAETPLRQFLLQDRQTYRRELARLLSAANPTEREALLSVLREAAGQGPAPASPQPVETPTVLLQLLERSPDPVRLLEQAMQSPGFRQTQVRETRERHVLERLTAFAQGRGGDWASESARLTQGLDRQERQLLVRHLSAVQALRRGPGQEEPSPTEAAPEARTSAGSILTFRTQREYKSFRYHLTRYLAGRPAPPEPLLPQVLRWAEDRRRWEEVTQVLRHPTPAPAPWSRPSQPGSRPSPAGSLSPGLSPAPPSGRTASAKVSLALFPTAERPAPAVEARSQRASTAPTPVSPPGQPSPEDRHQEVTRSMEFSTLPGKDRPRWEPPALTAAPPSGRPSFENRPQEAARSMVFSTFPGKKPPRWPSPALTTAPDFVRGTPGELSQGAPRSAPLFTPAGETPPSRRTPPTLALPLRSQGRGAVPVHFPESPAEVSPAWAPPGGTAARAPEGQPRRQPEPLRTAPVPHPARPAPPAALRLPFLTEPPPQAGQERPYPAADPPIPMALLPRLSPTLSPAPARAETPLPPPEPPELALRRSSVPEAAERAAERAVEERVELAVQRQAPELRLLRRQSREQEQALERQRQDLTGLRQRLERQEALVRQAVTQARVPGAQEPAQVRQLAKAVMRELEGQLRLERQRRGLI